MTMPGPRISIADPPPQAADRPHRFSHEAMATVFEVLIYGRQAEYAQQAAWAAFDEVDRLEAELSRFRPGSDIRRINGSAAGGLLRVSLGTYECLQVAAQVHAETDGAFDVTVGSLMALWQRAAEAGGEPPSDEELAAARARTGMDLVAINADEPAVGLKVEGVQIDLGGIGKGFALDRMGGLLREWEIRSALLCASTSTLLALDPPPGEEGWAAQLGPEDTPQRLALVNQALSASGMAVKGSHIIDPRAGRPAEGRFRARALAPTAALADALSTAFMIMGDGEVRSYCRRYPGISAWVLGSSTGACATIP